LSLINQDNSKSIMIDEYHKMANSIADTKCTFVLFVESEQTNIYIIVFTCCWVLKDVLEILNG
jgi:hypothetical protein